MSRGPDFQMNLRVWKGKKNEGIGKGAEPHYGKEGVIKG